MKVVIVSPEILGPHKNGDIAIFATNWAQMLRQNGNEVVIIYTGETNTSQEDWMSQYNGFEVIHVLENEPDYPHFNYESFVRRSEAVTAQIPNDAEVIYFQDWLANGFHFLRQRKFNATFRPVCVTVTHSSHQWILEANKTFPSRRQDLELSYAERYQVENSDFIASPSQYMLNYLRKKGWKLPAQDKIYTLGYPLNNPQHSISENIRAANQFNRLIYLGRLETRKGIELFVDALRYLKQQNPAAFQSVNEIALLGQVGVHRFGTSEELVRTIRECLPDVNVVDFSQFDTHETQSYLAKNAGNSLVVAPSLMDNFPYALIEASLIPKLNLISSNDGGQAEILGEAGRFQLFEPYVRPLAEKMQEKLAEGPRGDDQLGHYDWQNANQRWLEFHDKVSRSKAASFQVNMSVTRTLSVDVCVPYFNHAQYLPSALKSLSRQTTDNFNLYVINDGSTDINAQQVFEQMSKTYAHKSNWHFINREQNSGLSETRNYASTLGNADYLLFMDSDNIATPQMVERFAEAMQMTGYDCLTCNVFWFQGNDAPYFEQQPDILEKPVLYWPPLGNALELGLFQNCWGDANFIIKRPVFDAIGKFRIEETRDRYRTGEDTEILARLSFAGYNMDVIPEVLFFYRYLPNSMNRTANEYESMTRTLRVYADELQKIGLQHLIPWVYQVYKNSIALPPAQIIQPSDPHEAERIRHEVRLHYEDLKQDPQWIAENIPWRKVAQGVFYKLSKKLSLRRG